MSASRRSPVRARLSFAGLAAAAVAAIVAAALRWNPEVILAAVSPVIALCSVAILTWRWLVLRATSRVSTPEQLDVAARALAEAVESQWRTEAAARGLSSPDPARIGWVVTRRPVADAAARRWLTGTAATGTDPVASGGLDEILRHHRESPNGRLVILGAAGTGKTATAVLLVLAALRARQDADPVPVLIGIGAWDPRTEHLVDHVAGQLNRDHPYLMNPDYGRAAAAGLLTSGRATPVLDGFDELAPDRRAAAVTELNRSGIPRMVVTSRPEEYEDATDATVLAGAEVVELLPLDIDAVIAALSAGRAPRQLARWEPVFTAIRADPSGPVPTALTNPLTLALARQAYADADPAELLDARFGTVRAIRDHLLEGFVPARYDTHPGIDDPAGQAPLRYDGHRALRWLAFLAGQMERRRQPDLTWWHIPELVRPGWRILASTLTFTGFFWLIYIPVRDVAWLAYVALIGTPMIALAIAWQQRSIATPPATLGRIPSRGHIRRSLDIGYRVGLVTAAPASLVDLLLGLVYHRPQVPPLSITERVLDAVFAGLFIANIVAAIAALGTAVRNSVPTTAPDPGRSFSSHLLFLLAGRILPATVVMCLLFLAIAIGEDGMTGEDALQMALAHSLLVGAAFTLSEAGGQYVVAAGLLAVAGKVPWRPLRFLADAHRRGVLRQHGAAYQFRHAELQARLAILDGRRSHHGTS